MSAKHAKTNIWEWTEPNDLVPAGVAPSPQPQETWTVVSTSKVFSDANKRARDKQRIIDHSREVTTLEKAIDILKVTILALTCDNVEAEADIIKWKNVAELFRDGHSDSESFSEACEAYDLLTA